MPKRDNYLAPKEHSLLKLCQEVFVICMAFVGGLLGLALFSYDPSDNAWSHEGNTEVINNLTGKVGAYIADILVYFFGYIAYIVPLTLFFACFWFTSLRRVKTEISPTTFCLKLSGILLLLISCCAFATSWKLSWQAINLPYSLGGVLGLEFNNYASLVFGRAGGILIVVCLFMIGVTLTLNFSWQKFFAKMTKILQRIIAFGLVQGYKLSRKVITQNYNFLTRVIKVKRENFVKPLLQKPQASKVSKKNISENIDDFCFNKDTTAALEAKKNILPKLAKKQDIIAEDKTLLSVASNSIETKTENAKPESSLLADEGLHNSQNIEISNAELAQMAQAVEQKLADFGIAVKVVAALPGPVITRFELELAPGLKVSKISTLAKDLARALSVSSLRIVEVIAGKSVVGIEIPNKNRKIVGLRDLIEAPSYKEQASPLTLALGKDISGEVVLTDLCKMPHLLVAGTTGSGKSVGINAMLLSILYKAAPAECRLILIDPKMLELSIYEGIPHLLAPVVTDMKDAANALRWCVAEMERRYQLMASLGVRNLKSYNLKIELAAKKGKTILDPILQEQGREEALIKLPYIVVIIDEFADMMMVVGKKVEELIARIAQKARAAGIHMILATQRPSVDVITGLIKANVPTRIAFQVSSKIDSRTILDQQGAEQLLGYGDMLYLAPGTGIPTRVHGAFVGDDEVHRVVKSLKQQGKPDYVIEFNNASIPSLSLDSSLEDADPLYEEAVEFICNTKRASVSSLQRQLKIGFNRAARLMDIMEENGIVSAMQTNGTREVLCGDKK